MRTASRPPATSRVLQVVVERERARFGAWYEMFPRSAGRIRHEGGTFEDAAALLPYVASLGFDVLYLPPIHPIGRSFRKGKNNTLEAGPEDVGSPWAIGAEAGGHDAVEPSLGTIEDFDRFVAEARASRPRDRARPRLPGVARSSLREGASRVVPAAARRHDQVRREPAEEVPGHLPDQLRVERAGQALWTELKRVIEFWISHGVKIFRVDNPHTKPFQFWEWALADIKRRHPDTIFLSEAFTRPKVMRYLAKSGFSQSYTYFTWRNTKEELIEYFTELTRTDVREYMRPNLFANTPDILHEYLQHGGRPAFQIRLILAATLGATYGIYSGYELAENVPVKPGSEEYLDSEKYQIRLRNYEDPNSLAELIRRINTIRRDAPGAAARPRPALPRHRQRADHLLQQALAGRLRPDPDGGEPRSAPHAARLRPAAARRLGPARLTPRWRSSTCSRRALLLARRVELRAPRSAGARRPRAPGEVESLRHGRCRFAGAIQPNSSLDSRQADCESVWIASDA